MPLRGRLRSGFNDKGPSDEADCADESALALCCSFRGLPWLPWFFMLLTLALSYLARMSVVQAGGPNALGAIRVRPRSSAAQLVVDLPSQRRCVPAADDSAARAREASVPCSAANIEDGAPPASRTDEPLTLPRVAEPERSSTDRPARHQHLAARARRQRAGRIGRAHRFQLLPIVLRALRSWVVGHSDGSLAAMSGGMGTVFCTS